MSLTKGGGPLAERPGGERNFELTGAESALWLERRPCRVRARFGGETVADTYGAKLLHETSCLPVYYLPWKDVRAELFERSDKSSHCPFKGDATWWNVRVGAELAPSGAWSYDEPLEDARFLAGHVALVFDAMDEWLEEEERARVHPRDPYHRIDVLRGSRPAEVRVGGRTIARSDRPRLLLETGLPVRAYLPAQDVDGALLEPSSKRTRCPYKGEASYRTVVVDGERYEALVWCYDEPLAEAGAIARHLALPQEHEAVELLLGDELQSG